MKRSKSNQPPKKTKRFNGYINYEDNYEDEERELDPEIVSATEMTGKIPAVGYDEYESDTFEDYYPFM